MTRRRLKARRDRRGRPRKVDAKRRATTVAGRASAPDYGTEELRRHRLDITGSTDLPADVLGALHGRGILDRAEYATGIEFAALVALVRRALGLNEASAAGTWRNILSATPGGHAAVDAHYPGAERARRALARFRRALGASLWRAIADAADNVWPGADDAEGWITDLRHALLYLEDELPLRRRSAG
jgi:hypothetical protein